MTGAEMPVLGESNAASPICTKIEPHLILDTNLTSNSEAEDEADALAQVMSSVRPFAIAKSRLTSQKLPPPISLANLFYHTPAEASTSLTKLSSMVMSSSGTLPMLADSVDNSLDSINRTRVVSFSQTILARTFNSNSPPSRKRRRSKFHSSLMTLQSAFLGSTSSLAHRRARSSDYLSSMTSTASAQQPFKSILKKCSSGDAINKQFKRTRTEPSRPTVSQSADSIYASNESFAVDDDGYPMMTVLTEAEYEQFCSKQQVPPCSRTQSCFSCDSLCEDKEGSDESKSRKASNNLFSSLVRGLQKLNIQKKGTSVPKDGSSDCQ